MERKAPFHASLAACQIARFVRTGCGLSVDEARSRYPDEALWGPPGACFVSIKGSDGSLRGCIGTILPTTPSLGEEILTNAVAACSQDPRFLPVTSPELPGLRISVDVLSAPEPISSPEELDPRKYGVIVSRGRARGLLLPDLPGVDSVEEQLRIACAKAGLASPQGVQLARFTVERYDGGEAVDAASAPA